MKRITLFFLLALAAIVQIQANTAQDAVDKFVAHNSLRYASVGVTVIDLDSAKCIASYRPEQANITASTMKTVVSSAALGLLGPHFRFETPVYLDGTIQDGLFTGNIVIRGLGDPTLGSVFLPCQANIVEEIIAALRANAGAAAPFDIMPAVWFSSMISVSAGLATAFLFKKLWPCSR
jgi:D-alanyl-D-alanine carboxypeptidase